MNINTLQLEMQESSMKKVSLSPTIRRSILKIDKRTKAFARNNSGQVSEDDALSFMDEPDSAQRRFSLVDRRKTSIKIKMTET